MIKKQSATIEIKPVIGEEIAAFYCPWELRYNLKNKKDQSLGVCMSLQESLLRWKEKGIFLMVLLIRKNVDVYCMSKNEDFFFQ